VTNVPPRIVVDSSVAIKWLSPEGEEGVAAAHELLEAHLAGNVRLCAPSFLLLEVLNSLRFRGLDGADLDSVASELLNLGLAMTASDRLAQRAAVVAFAYDLTVYDATFAALAEQLDAELVTADRRLAECGACRTRLL
jgi:predicted nucleic acid-binding protein